jgi:3-vinyl bacteriochlorophyllide hydratase
MAVIALHTAYLYVMLTGTLPVREQMLLALIAYGSYVVNALQFFYKLYLAKRTAAANNLIEDTADPHAAMEPSA